MDSVAGTDALAFDAVRVSSDEKTSDAIATSLPTETLQGIVSGDIDGPAR